MELEEMLKGLVALGIKLLLQNKALSTSQEFMVTGNILVAGKCYKSLKKAEHNRGAKEGM